jgi:hypothetical protein
VCRKDIRKQKLKKNKLIDEAVKEMVEHKKQENNEEYDRWKKRVESYKQFKDKHKMHLPGKVLKAGDKIDVRDTEFIWCKGVIELKIST